MPKDVESQKNTSAEECGFYYLLQCPTHRQEDGLRQGKTRQSYDHFQNVIPISPPPQPLYGPFSGTTRVSRCQKRTSGLYDARED